MAALANAILAKDVARAANEWTVADWLAADERLLGSIVVAPQDPAGAAARDPPRAAEHPRMVQVLLASPPRLLGDPFMHPIYDAAASSGCRCTWSPAASSADWPWRHRRSRASRALSPGSPPPSRISRA